jgi:hypothetical protein
VLSARLVKVGETVATTAREVRAAVRAELAEQVRARQEAALSVALAWAKVEKARERLAAAEQEVGTAALMAVEKLPVADLAKLSGVPTAELRRLIRAARVVPSASVDGQPVEAKPGATDVPAEPAPVSVTD